MKRLLSVALMCLLSLCLSYCYGDTVPTENSEKQTEKKETPKASADRLDDFSYPYYSQLEDASISLRIHEITSLPDGKILLGGSYSCRASTVHTVLLVSQDGGHTWKDAGVKVNSCGVMNFQTFGLNHVWAIATFLTEGCNTPTSLLYSTDAGQNWSSLSLNFIGPMEAFFGVQYFHFFDELRGLLIMKGCLGTKKVFTTFDGGKNWEKIMASKKDIPRDIDIEPNWPDYTRQNINRAAIWKKTPHNYYKISGWIRVRKTDSYNEPYIVIESQNFDNREWKQISQIPRYYKVEKDTIIPVDSGKKEDSSLQIRFKINKAKFEVGEWVSGTLYLKNTSSDIVHVPNISPGKGHLGSSCVQHGIVRFDLERNGQKVKMLEKRPKESAGKSIIPLKELKPGQTVKANVPLSWPYAPRLFSLDQTGSYKVTAVLDTNEHESTEIWKGRIKTEPVLFTISKVHKFRDKQANETGLDYAIEKVNYYLERNSRREGSYSGNVSEILNTDEGVPALILALDLPSEQKIVERILIDISTDAGLPTESKSHSKSKEYWQKWWTDTGSKMTVQQLMSNFGSRRQ